MALTVYLLCAVASLLCAVLLWRGYRASRARLLFWAALCFFILVVTNSLLFVDFIIFPHIDLAVWRSGITLGAFGLFLYGLIFDAHA